MQYINKIKEATNFLKEKINNFNPQFGIVLGTGLGALVNDIKIDYEFSYADIPNFPISTLEMHKGKLIFGELSGKKVVCMQGRFHYYEGYNMKEVTFPIRVLKLLGIEKLFISNAAGGLKASNEKGDLMIIEDHIYLQYENPLTGKNLDGFGGRFPDMLEPYDKQLITKGLEIAKKHNFRCESGVYVSVPGPNLETKAEYKYLNLIGADAVGMSTAPEVIVAVHMNLPVFAISVITDVCFPIERIVPVTIPDILKVAAEAEPKMTKIIKELIAIA